MGLGDMRFWIEPTPSGIDFIFPRNTPFDDPLPRPSGEDEVLVPDRVLAGLQRRGSEEAGKRPADGDDDDEREDRRGDAQSVPPERMVVNAGGRVGHRNLLAWFPTRIWDAHRPRNALGTRAAAENDSDAIPHTPAQNHCGKSDSLGP